MELKEFIKEALTQIVEGTSHAQEMAIEHGAIVNPSNVNFHVNGENNFYDDPIPRDVTFDVALTTVEKDGSKEGIGVFLGAISLGKGNDSAMERTELTRIQFSIPITLPPGTANNAKRTARKTRSI